MAEADETMMTALEGAEGALPAGPAQPVKPAQSPKSAPACETPREMPSEALRSPQKADSGEGHKEGHLPHKRSPHRILNAWIALALCLIFAAHALLGAVHVAWPAFYGSLVWVVWIG
ncbi:MAG: hypothetical protein IKF96_01250, partial [Eggerthellaceae bacterium]|nr:hypothetical protein [Eggerthellaceae bacterium]